MPFKTGYVVEFKSDGNKKNDNLAGVFPSLESLGKYIAGQGHCFDKCIPFEVRHIGIYFEHFDEVCAQTECEA